jgi:hypothetical protein
MATKAQRAEKLIDKRIDAAYRATCSGVAINIMDITKVFAKGRELIATGVDDAALGVGLRAFVDTIA